MATKKWVSLSKLQRAFSDLAAKRLDTLEEIKANTSPGMLAGADAVAELNSNLVAEDNLQFKFGKDGDGNYGYYGADGSLIPFKSASFDYREISLNGKDTPITISDVTKEPKHVSFICYHSSYATSIEFVASKEQNFMKGYYRTAEENSGIVDTTYSDHITFNPSDNTLKVSFQDGKSYRGYGYQKLILWIVY